MTTPAEPDTGAGTPPDTGSAPENPSTEAQPTAPDTDVTDWQAEAEKFKALARKHEDRAKANKQALDKAAAATAGEPTVDDLKAQLAEEREARNAEAEEKAELAYENAVNRIAGTANADADALLDSDSFRAAVNEELEDDFTRDDLAKAVTKVAKEYAKKPRFAKHTGPARSGADLPGGPAGLRQLTEDDLTRMSPEQIVSAQDKGQLNSLLGIT